MSDKRRRPVVGKLITPAGTRSTIPFECKVLSPTGIINRDIGGIGLGIVAALENIPAKKTSFSCRIPVGQTRIVDDRKKREKASSLEDEYTIVTRQKPNKLITKFYQAQQAIELRDQSCIFHISPARCGGDDTKVCQPAGFLSSCYLCSKRLQGRDIYMYRGEKAFCSPECRSRQISMDEKPEKYCSSQVSSSGTSHLITTGIFAI